MNRKRRALSNTIASFIVWTDISNKLDSAKRSGKRSEIVWIERKIVHGGIRASNASIAASTLFRRKRLLAVVAGRKNERRKSDICSIVKSTTHNGTPPHPLRNVLETHRTVSRSYPVVNV